MDQDKRHGERRKGVDAGSYLMGRDIQHIFHRLDEIMATVQEIRALAVANRDALVGLRTAVDAEQAQVADALSKLQVIIDGADAQLQTDLEEVKTILTESAAHIASAQADVESTVNTAIPSA